MQRTSQRMNAVQCSTERFMENIADPSTATQFGRLNVSGRTFDCRTVCARKLCNDLQ